MRNAQTASGPLAYYELDRAELYAFAATGRLRLSGRALNVGCGAGRDADHLRGLGASVLHGIEPVQPAADAARRRYDHVFPGPVEDWHWDGQPYELVVFADVLEHVVDPGALLHRARSWLSPSGYLLISVPNIRHVSVLYNLAICGQWEYTEHGIMDRTHLRFFTSRSIIRLLCSAGYETNDLFRWGATRTARTVARAFPPSGEFLLSQIFLTAQAAAG